MTKQAPLLTPDFSRMETLRDKLLSDLRPHLGGKRAVYIDYPMHLNVGDLLIQAGTEAVFDALQTNVMMRISERNANRLFEATIPSDAVLVLHGGGNFGDLYPHHQNLREQVIEAFPNNKILIMPQSVHYNDEAALFASAAIYQNHPELYMFVRDNPSRDVMSKVLSDKQLHMLPDMAFGLLGKWQWPSSLANKTLTLRRRDIEANPADGSVDEFDWDNLFTTGDNLFYSFARRLARLENRFKLNLGLDKLWWLYIQNMMNRAIRHFSQYGRVDTDRLHGMILSLLLGLEVSMRDNSYGKLRRYAECWLGLDSSDGIEKKAS
ncbi:hypothetical protein EZV61_12485 [Corallincola luteus]|uniref:Polysaccharide pyruvyl transferase domain-containing protein n=1 Tax=Corallincola luteus TaxID=1775177 RepID=A0ABY2AIP7_9GAMM|nr:polysaccharide pyruvyl transferase family protein [Corallincola luteus]TCI02614.1 hypothetical protein EZV61_12485 [Corallincola luteus]